MRESRTDRSSVSTQIDGSFRSRAEANFRNRKFGRVCAVLWEKPDTALATIAGVSDRAARDYLSGKVAPPAVVIAAINVEITKRCEPRHVGATKNSAESTAPGMVSVAFVASFPRVLARRFHLSGGQMRSSDLAIPAFLDRSKDADLPALADLINDAARTLANAHSAAEVLDAKDKAGLAYDAAKRAARFSKAKDAHNIVVAAAHRAQARALEIEAGAKRRLADEYDAAQARGEVAAHGGRRGVKIPEGNLESVGLSAKAMHEAREIRDAEQADPGVVSRTLKEAVETGAEPTRAKIRRVVKAMSKRRRPARREPYPVESEHDRDLRMLVGMWKAACQSAREEFLKLAQQGAI